MNHKKSTDQVYAPLPGSDWQASTASLVQDGSYGFTETLSIRAVLKFKKSVRKIFAGSMVVFQVLSIWYCVI